MRIGLFGGSFDPVHLGHLILAEQCREQARLDEVWWIPAAVSPLKERGPFASDRQRLEMLELAVAGHSAFRVVDVELKRGGTSYTVETLETFRQEYPDREFFLLLGSDSLASFARWRDPSRICALATPLVYARPGTSVAWDSLAPFVAPERLQAYTELALRSRLIDISSSDLRERIRQGMSIRYLVPRAVEQYIIHQKLYAE